LITTYYLNKEILVLKLNPTCSREREIYIIEKEHDLIPLHRNIYSMTRNPRNKQIHPNEVERRMHLNIVEILDMWRKFSIRRETI
jgi:hypothetical protein